MEARRGGSLALYIEKLLEQLRRLVTEGLRELAKLDHVDPTLAPLDLRHETLGPAQPLRQLDLSDASRLPHRGDEADELLMPLREDR